MVVAMYLSTVFKDNSAAIGRGMSLKFYSFAIPLHICHSMYAILS